MSLTTLTHNQHDVSSIWERTNYHLRRIDEDRTIAHAWPEEALFGSMFCACATGSGAISALVWPFSPEVTVTWTEEALSCITFIPVIFFRTFFPRPFFPALVVSRTFSPYFLFPVLLSPVNFFSYYFSVIFSRNFFSRTFLSRNIFPYIFFRTFFPVFFSPVLFSSTFSKVATTNVLIYQWVVFLVHVVITQFMFLVEYPFKRHL